MGTFSRLLPALCLAVTFSPHAFAADVAGTRRVPSAGLEPLLKQLLAVGPNGAGNREARAAWEQVARADVSHLPTILAALDEAGPLSANWVRCAADTIAERELRRGGKLPREELEQFVLDRQHAPRARRLAYEWLVRVDPTASDRLIPGMLDDPSVELRRDAVARLIDEAAQMAEGGEPRKAVPLCRKALTAARDLDQIRLLASRLRKQDEPVDLARHFGFIVRWKLIGPFDNTGEKGYDVAYPPEREIDLTASYPGKHGPVTWIEHESGHEFGRVDLNKALVEEKDVVGYATTEFVSDREREVEFRLASDNAVKLWLAGTLLDEHNVYHAGSQFDQYASGGVLRPGRNVILVKVCQNAQTQNWARGWSFQLRLCDSTGGAVLSRDRE